MGKQIIFVHGRHFKPGAGTLKDNWLEALRHGLDRDGYSDAGEKLEALIQDNRTKLAYYGDLSNAFLTKHTDEKYDADADAKDRENALETLKGHTKNALTDGTFYNALPHASPWKEALADAFGSVAAYLKVSEFAINAVMPDLTEYWNPDSAFGSNVRARLTSYLRNALMQEDKVLIIAHSLGTVVAYDVLWKMCYMSEHGSLPKHKPRVDLLTLGSPLGDETVKRNLKGAGASGKRRYPSNIDTWWNVAAEDDYISYDQSLANDYSEMNRHHSTVIKDIETFNMAVRFGKSNPHHGTGYLISPEVASIVGNWLE